MSIASSVSSATHTGTASASSTTMQEYLTFRRMITPVVIQVIFWVGVGLFALAGLGGVIAGIAGGGILMILGSLVFMVVGPIMVRIYCELLILFFRMNQTLSDIRDLTAART